MSTAQSLEEAAEPEAEREWLVEIERRSGELKSGKVKGVPISKVLKNARAAVTLIFHPLAEDELIAAARFYESRVPGLGADFIRQIERTLAEVAAHPGAGSLISGAVIKWCLTQRFPFAIVLRVRARRYCRCRDHASTPRPGYWKPRRLRSQARR